MANAKAYTEQVAQVGVEVTPGVAQEPTIRFNRGTLTIAPATETEEIRVNGEYLPSGHYVTGEGSTATYAGVPDFNELTPGFDAVFGEPEITVLPSGAVERVYTLKADRKRWSGYLGDSEAAAVAVGLMA